LFLNTFTVDFFKLFLLLKPSFVNLIHCEQFSTSKSFVYFWRGLFAFILFFVVHNEMHFFLCILKLLLSIILLLIFFFFKILHLNVIIILNFILDFRIKYFFLFNNVRVNNKWWLFFCRSQFFLRKKYLVDEFRLLSLINHFLKNFLQDSIFWRTFSILITAHFLIKHLIFILGYSIIFNMIWLKRGIIALRLH
jgi:hypothetical protein